MVQGLSLTPLTGFDMDQHWRLDSEVGRDLGPAYKIPQGWEDSHDFAVPACFGVVMVAGNLYVVVVGRGADRQAVEGDIEAAVVVGRGCYFVEDSDNTHLR